MKRSNRQDGTRGIPEQPGGAPVDLTHVTSVAHGCRFHTPDLPADGHETITLAEYQAWAETTGRDPRKADRT